MQIIDIAIEKKASDVAHCTAVVLKVNDLYRYLFVPKLIDNSNETAKCISGKFIIQKKNKKDQWEDHNNLALNKMISDQWINLDLSTSSLELLISYITELKDMYLSSGKYECFDTVKTCIFSNDMTTEEKEILFDVSKKLPQFNDEIRGVLLETLESKDILNILNNGKINLDDLGNGLNDNNVNGLYNVLQAKLINPCYLEDNFDNTNEDYWQDLFKSHPNIISSVIPSVIHLIEEQPYMGGKAIDNKGGNIGDFIFRSGTKNVSIIEIKTPSTSLIGKEYRDTVFSPSKDLVGSIIQIQKQRDSHLKEYNSSKVNSAKKGIEFDSYNPKLYIIIGNTSNLNIEEIESFEIFRNGLKDIEIITFNELVDKLKMITRHLSNDPINVIKDN